MAVSYKTLRSKREWASTTGLTEEKFFKLVEHFSHAYEDLYGEDLNTRQSNSSTESHLKSYEEYLFFILFGLKSGLTNDALGFVFGMSGSNANKIQNLGIRILKMALIRCGSMPKRMFKNLEDFENTINKEETIKIDGTEQPVQRPVNQSEQKELYSGKKKTYRKNNRDKRE